MRQDRDILAGERLKDFRKKMGWTRDDLAYAACVSVRTIFNYETLGIPKNWTKLGRICAALGIHLDEILGHSAFGIEERLLDPKTPTQSIVDILEFLIG